MPSLTSSGLRVVIIGAGMSGVLMGARLCAAGVIDFTIYEKGDRIGGTWRENHYPGLHCDVPSHHYCYSFDLNADWNKTFSSGPEIREYFEQSAIRHGVMPHIRFKTALLDAQWTGSGWEIGLSTGERDFAHVLISAAGVLHVPNYPMIEGLQSFAGVTFHTARWDHSIDLADKRIGIIGTGSTAAQIVTELSGKVRHLTLFQRTAQWVAKIPNPEISEKMRRRFRRFPLLMKLLYHKIRHDTATVTAAAVMGSNAKARAHLLNNVESNLASVADPVLREKLRPDYQVGCKRLVMSPNFYEAIQHPQASLVTERIERIEPRGIVTRDGTLHELDLLVLATGFDANAFLRPARLTGRDGTTLDQLWAERPIAYHSMAVPDMPNFFMLEGPFSPIGNLSLVLISEWQADYIMKCLRIIARRRVAMSPTRSATASLMTRYREEAKRTIWARANGGCQSWYQDAEGVPIIYPFTPNHFRKETRVSPNLADFDLVPLTQRDSLAA